MNKPMGVESVIKDTKTLREFLVQQMGAAANGRVDAERGKTVANFAQQVYNTLNIELRMAIAKAKLGDTKVEPVNFGD
jgi:hypothetical protein